jgi:hypothetical protein
MQRLERNGENGWIKITNQKNLFGSSFTEKKVVPKAYTIPKQWTKLSVLAGLTANPTKEIKIVFISFFRKEIQKATGVK